MQEWLNDLSSLIYPEFCLHCQTTLLDQEHNFCLHCLVGGFSAAHPPKNIPWIKQQLPLPKRVSNVFSLFEYHKKAFGSTLIKQIKYHNKKQLGFASGQWLGAHLNKSKGFNKIDYIVPIPSHKNKLKTRGYNQSEIIAKGVAYALNKPVEFFKLKQSFKPIQLGLKRIDRFVNAYQSFGVLTNQKLMQRHILLVDDVITTGATLDALVKHITKTHHLNISIASLAFTPNASSI